MTTNPADATPEPIVDTEKPVDHGDHALVRDLRLRRRHQQHEPRPYARTP